MRPSAQQVRGLAGAFAGRHAVATTLAILDSRRFVRSCFLASGVRTGLLPFMGPGRLLAELVVESGSGRPDRLEAWLAVGVELGELGRRGERYVVVGRRARALSDGDPLLTAHYRSMLDYQLGPYVGLSELISSAEAGRDDLAVHARTIAEVSLAAEPFIVPFLQELVERARPRRALDIGCGTGVYMRALVEADPLIRVEGIDLAADVASEAAARMNAAGLSERVAVHVGDVRSWEPSSEGTFDLVTLCNNIYYFPRDDRAALYRQLGRLLAPGGMLVITTMTRPGSAASAHLHFMLCCQTGAAGLPRRGEIEVDLRDAGFAVVRARHLVPTEPFVGVTARL